MWKQLRDTNYEVSQDGQVRVISKGLILKNLVMNNYKYVSLSIDKRPKRIPVHRLVAEVWVDNPKPDTNILVNHKNGDKQNNHYLNLEWVSPRTNALHALATGLSKNPRKLTMQQAEDIRKAYNENEKITYKELAEQYNVSVPVIHHIILKNTYTVGLGGE